MFDCGNPFPHLLCNFKISASTCIRVVFPILGSWTKMRTMQAFKKPETAFIDFFLRCGGSNQQLPSCGNKSEEKAETAMGSGKTAGRVSARSSARSGCRCPFGGCVCGSRRSSTALEDRNHFSSIKKTRNQKTLSNARTSENVIVRTLRSAQGGMGIILFTIFVCLYITDFYNLSSARSEDEGSFSETDAGRVEQPPISFLAANSEKKATVMYLPGAVMSERKSFENDPSESMQRDPNTLPGAIGSTGAFDNHELSPSSKEKSASETSKTNDNPSKNEKPANDKNKKTKQKTYSSHKPKSPSRETKLQPAKSKVDAPRSGGVSSRFTAHKQTDKLISKATDSISETENEVSREEVGKNNDDGPITTGSHPMNRNMEELQVAGGTGPLGERAVRSAYEKLIKAYLAPFAGGIKRQSFFEILRRRTYALAPPGANKGIQTILFQIIKKHVYYLDPYDVAQNSKPFYKTRLKELIWLLSEIAKQGNVPDTEFLLAIHDCVQTVSRKHTYRGPVYTESNPTFTIVSCNFSDNIPFPMWEGDKVRGGLRTWDDKIEKYKAADTTPWKKKISQAVFRGGNRPSMFFQKKKDADDHCDEFGRSRLRFLGTKHPELFDVGVGGSCGGKTHYLSRLSEEGHHKYKYILYAEGNCFWADRLNKQIFGPSAVLKQETPCGQFWEPLLKPMTHYIPTDFFFSDTVEKLSWAREHDDEVQNIVKNANNFAGSFLSFKGIKTYVEVLLTEYTKLLERSEIRPEKGSVDVTV